MNNKRNLYCSDTRYEKVWEQMQLLGIQDVSTERQIKNGTITWRLPIKNNWPGNQANATCIEVASFASGYVRNNNSGYSNYQLNKRCESEPDYYKIERNGETLYRKFTTRTCKLIPIEIDRLEYLISYCLKNYYIKNANQVPNGDFVPKWKYENAQSGDDLENMTRAKDYYKEKYDEAIDLGRTNAEAEALSDCGHYDRIRDLENKLEKEKETYDMLAKDYDIMRKSAQKSGDCGHYDRIRELERVVNKQAERLHQIYLKARS